MPLDIASLFAAEPLPEWENVSPILQRRRRPNGSFQYRTRPGGIPGALPADRVTLPKAPEDLSFGSQVAEMGRRAARLGDRAVSAAAEGIAALPELAAAAAPYLGGGPSGSAQIPEADTPENPFPVEAYPTIGKPGGFLDLKAQRKDIHRQYEGARERLLSTPGVEPGVLAAVDTLAEATGQSLPFGKGAVAAKEAERALETAGQRTLRKAMGETGAVKKAAEEASQRLPRDLVEGSAEEAEFLRRRQRMLASPPGQEGEIARPEIGALFATPPEERARRAAAEAALPRTRAEVDARLGLRATPEEGAALARLSLPIGEEPPAGVTTSLKNAVTEAERVARGLPEVETLGRKSSGEEWLRAKAAFTEDPELPRRLAAVVADKPRPLTVFENDVLLHDRMKLTLDHREAVAAEAEALKSGDREALTLARLNRVSAEAAMNVNDKAARLGGREWGLAGQARQKLIAEDYSPLHLVQRARVANAGVEVPEAVKGQLFAVSKDLEAALERARLAEEKVSQLEVDRVVKMTQQAEVRTARSGRRLATRQQLDAEFEGLQGEWRKKTRGQINAGLDPDLVPIVAKMARNRVRAGVTDTAQLVDGIFQIVKDDVEGLEPRDVRDAISGYGLTRQHATQSEAAKELARIRAELKAASALEDAEAGLVPARGPRPAPPSPVVTDLRKQVREAMRSRGLKLSGEPLASPEASALKAYKTRLATREQELAEQVASGNFTKKARRPLPLDSEALQAQARVKELQRKADGIIRGIELSKRTKAEKALDWTAGWGRFVKLTGVATIQKIGAAASMRTLVFKPVEEVLGAGWSKAPLVGRMIADAPIEGGGDLGAIAKSYREFFSSGTRREMIANLSNREGELDLLYGHPHPSEGKVPAFMGYPGKVHAAFKAPTKRAGFAYASAKQAKFNRAIEAQAKQALASGRAAQLLDPVVQEEMNAAAYEYASRDIFMGKNAMTEAFNNALRDTPGQSLAAKAGKTTGRVLFPIVSVPTNYALEITDYTLGLPKGLARIANAVRQGVRQLPREQAELVARQLKKGTLGAGLIALGATGVVEVGGYWRPGERRREGELQPGEVRIAGWNVPHMLLHHPAVEALQVGGQLYRARQRFHGREGWLGEGLGEAAEGVAEQVPFYEETVRAGRDLSKEGGKARFAGEVGRGMVIPPDIQRLARILDQRGEHDKAEMLLQEFGYGHIDANRRTPRGGALEILREEMLLGIPGMRDDVR